MRHATHHLTRDTDGNTRHVTATPTEHETTLTLMSIWHAIGPAGRAGITALTHIEGTIAPDTIAAALGGWDRVRHLAAVLAIDISEHDLIDEDDPDLGRRPRVLHDEALLRQCEACNAWREPGRTTCPEHSARFDGERELEHAERLAADAAEVAWMKRGA